MIQIIIGLIFALFFSVLYRLRGAEEKLWLIRLDKAALLGLGLMISGLILIASNSALSLWAAALYIIGERPAWGKFIGTCITRECQYEKPGGIFGFIANLIVRERNNCVLYSQVALILRALYWFVPLFLFIYCIVGTTFVAYLSSVLIISFCFPVSIELGKVLPVPALWVVNPESWGERIWSKAELIYGFIQGIVIYFLIF